MSRLGPIRRYLGQLRALASPPSVARQATLQMMHTDVLRGLGFGDVNPVLNGELTAARSILEAITDRSGIVFDVGANRGDYSAMLLDGVRAEFDIHCFEPSPTAFAELERRFVGNPRVRMHNIGLSNVEGRGTLKADERGSETGTLYDRPGLQQDSTESVQLRTLDAVCDELALSFIDLLKVDAEGHDISVLRGASNLLDAETIGAVQFEHGGTAPDSRTFLRDFFDLLAPTYLIHRILPDGLWRLARYTEDLEITVYANYLAICRSRL